MITRMLWRALADPPFQHPVFRHVAETPRAGRDWIGVWIAVGLATAAVFLCSIISSGFRWTTTALSMLPLLLPLLVNLRALGWSLEVAGALGKERERATWDLLRVLPEGGLAASWAIASAWMFRHQTLDNVRLLIQTVLGIAAVAVTAITLVAAVSLDAGRARGLSADALPSGFFIISVGTIALLYVDFTQTVILAAVLGTFAGATARPQDARGLSGALFAVIQISLYLLTALIGVGLLPAIYQSIGLTGLLPLITLAIFRFVMLCGLREVVLIVLWRRLADELGGETLAPRLTG